MNTNVINNLFERVWTYIYDTCYEFYKGLTANPQWLLMRKIGRFKTGRDIMRYLSSSSAKSYQLSVGERSSLFEGVNVDEAVSYLKTEGFYLGINLPQNVVQEIVEFAQSTACYGNRKSELGFYYDRKQQAQSKSLKKFLQGYYFNTALLCPAIDKLQNDPTLLAIAAKYLERSPVHQGNHLWWSFPGETTHRERSKCAQIFHYDLDDYRFLKFFFYLTDVDEFSGPHVCIRRSHQNKKLSHLLLRKRETDEDIINYYGQESLVTIYGKAGFGFVEDPLCFHKGTTPIQHDRLMLQIEYATTDYGLQHDRRETSLLKVLS